MKLLLVRHGRTDANVMGALDTAYPGMPLDEQGLSQAQALVPSLEAQGLMEEISSLWVSPIVRAQQTIAPLARALGTTPLVRSGLREVLAGDLEMNTDLASMQRYIHTSRAWMSGFTHALIPGSPEDGAQTFERFDTVVREIAEVTPEQGTALLVAHGTVLRLWTSLAACDNTEWDPRWIANHPMRNTALSIVEGDPASGWRLTAWNVGGEGVCYSTSPTQKPLSDQ